MDCQPLVLFRRAPAFANLSPDLSAEALAQAETLAKVEASS
jgi:hypothetical protein